MIDFDENNNIQNNNHGFRFREKNLMEDVNSTVLKMMTYLEYKKKTRDILRFMDQHQNS